MKQRRPIDDEAVRVVRYTCPQCGRWLEEVAGRRKAAMNSARGY